jgi:hypothetical protein
MNNFLEIQGVPHCIIINPKGIVVSEDYPHLEGFESTSEVIEDPINKTS